MKPPSLFARLCCAAVVVFILGLLIGFVAHLALPRITPENRALAGCYDGGQLIPYIECRGFFGATLMNLFIGWPWSFVATAYFIIGAPTVFLDPYFFRKPVAVLVVLAPFALQFIVLVVGAVTWWRLFWSAWRGENWLDEVEVGKSAIASPESSPGAEDGR
jgi:hypothetical protein